MEDRGSGILEAKKTSPLCNVHAAVMSRVPPWIREQRYAGIHSTWLVGLRRSLVRVSECASNSPSPRDHRKTRAAEHVLRDRHKRLGHGHRVATLCDHRVQRGHWPNQHNRLCDSWNGRPDDIAPVVAPGDYPVCTDRRRIAARLRRDALDPGQRCQDA